MKRGTKKSPHEDFITSLFKNSGMKFWLDRPYLIFSCFTCSKEVSLNLESQQWECRSCNSNGMLTNLIANLNDGILPKGEPYNPKKERDEIKKELNSIIKRYPELTNRLDRLGNKINGLWIYLMENPQRTNLK